MEHSVLGVALGALHASSRSIFPTALLVGVLSSGCDDWEDRLQGAFLHPSTVDLWGWVLPGCPGHSRRISSCETYYHCSCALVSSLANVPTTRILEIVN